MTAQPASTSTEMDDVTYLRVFWGKPPVPDEAELAREAHCLRVLRRRGERLRERLSSVPFHQRKVALYKEQGRDEMEYWMSFAPQRVEPDDVD